MVLTRSTRIAVVFLAIAAVFCVHCAETRRSLGEECLRNEDCLSDVCAARSCVNPPPTTNKGSGSQLPTTPDIDAAVIVDAGDGG